MPVLTRDQIRRPSLAKETVDCPGLGGEIVLRGMTLTERLRLSQETGFAGVAAALACCVLDADGEPAMTLEEWEAFGDVSAAIALYNKVRQLSLFDREDVEKKSESAPT